MYRRAESFVLLCVFDECECVDVDCYRELFEGVG